MVVFVGGLGLGSWVLRTWDFGLWAGCRPKASEDESFRVGVLSTQAGEGIRRVLLGGNLGEMQDSAAT